MYAVFQSGGKQHRVTEGQTIRLEKLDVETTYWFIDEKYTPGDQERMCPWPFSRAYVSSDMRVVPCCMIANPEISDLGPATEFSRTWNSKEMGDFRSSHIEGKIPSICRSCYKHEVVQVRSKTKLIY